MTREEAKEAIIRKTQKETTNIKVGGFNLNGPGYVRCKLVNSHIKTEIEIGYQTKEIRNYEIAMTLMELAIDAYLDHWFEIRYKNNDVSMFNPKPTKPKLFMRLMYTTDPDYNKGMTCLVTETGEILAKHYDPGLLKYDHEKYILEVVRSDAKLAGYEKT